MSNDSVGAPHVSCLQKPKKKPPGLPPGTLIYTGNKDQTEVEISLWDYDEKGYREREKVPVEDCAAFKGTSTVTWININGVHDTRIIEKLGQDFDIHPLVLEDILNTRHRPKLEAFDGYLFLILKMFYLDETGDLKNEQVQLIVGSDYVLSFQEEPGDIFEPVRERIRVGKGRLRKSGVDYLAYTLLDTVIDHGFIVAERLGERIDTLEEDIIEERSDLAETMSEINYFKKRIVFLRRTIWPFRELVGSLLKDETGLVKDKTKVFLRDVYDHVIQLGEFTDMYRDLLKDMTDLHNSQLSNRMNEVMKFLTIIGTIFIPLTFIAGIYGMNFENMPELRWGFGYPVAVGGMLVIGSLLILYFRRKGWL